jgi:nicotinamide-nucleotide amidase
MKANELKRLLLGPPRRTLAVAESMSGGRLQALITAVPGASEFFLGGVTAYALEQKAGLLGVERAHAAVVDCVSERVAGEMAAGACRLFGADWALATTGYAEPAAAAGVALPYAWVAIARQSGAGPVVMRSWRVECPGATRTEAQTRVAEAAVAAFTALLSESSGGAGA